MILQRTGGTRRARASARSGARGLGRILWRAVAAELLLSAASTFCLLAAVALTRSVLESADLVINRGLGASAVGAVASFQLLPIAAQTLPFAWLIGALVGLGRLHADGELLAFEASGIRPLALLAPVASVAVVLVVLGGGLSLSWSPAAQRGLASELARIAAEHSSATLRAGVVARFGERELLAREVSADGRRLRGVLLWNPATGETLFAEQAELAPAGSGRTRAELMDVAILMAPESATQLVRTAQFRTELVSEAVPVREFASDPLVLARVGALLAIARAAEAKPSEARLAQAEIHRRLALATTPLLFGALALGLVLGSARSSRASAALWGIGLAIVYYGLDQAAQGLLRFETLPVALAVWSPNVCFAALSLLSLWRHRGGARASGREAPSWVVRWRRQRADGVTGNPAPRRRALDRYVLASFVELALAALLVLTLSYLAIDAMERLGWFARHRATPGEVLHFYSARIFLLVSRVAPMALLAGAALAVAWLERTHELVAMQASGIRLARALAPIALAAGLAVPVCFGLTEWLAPRTNARADEIKEQEIKNGAGGERGVVAWYRHGEQLVHASRLAFEKGRVEALTVYRLDPDGLPTQRIDARVARHIGGGRWELDGGRRLELSRHGITGEHEQTTLELAGVESGLRDPMHMSVWELDREIARAHGDGYDTTAYRTDWHRKLAAPFACLLLPGLAILLAASRREPRSLAVAFLASAALGISYLVLGDVMAALAYGGRVPAALAGWGVPLLFGGLAMALAWRVRR